MNLNALENRVIIKPVMVDRDAETNLVIHKSGLLIMPDRTTDREGEVVSVGPKAKTEIKPGDIVVFNEYAGDMFNFEGAQYRIMSEHEIWGKR